MPWLKFISLAVLGWFYTSLSLANTTVSLVSNAEQLPSSISLYNHDYAIELHENRELIERLTLVEEPLVDDPLVERLPTTHYRGKLIGHDDSWLRLSKTAGRWQGVVFLSGQIYQIELPVSSAGPHQDAGSNQDVGSHQDAGLNQEESPQKLQAVIQQDALTAQPIEDTGNAMCGTHNPGIASQRQSFSPIHSALSVAQEVQFSSLCSTTVDGVCLLAEIEFAFDQQFQTEFGSNAQSQAIAIINMAEGFYRNDFNIIFDTISVELLTSDIFATTTDASDLIDNIAELKGTGQIPSIQNERALFHLVTGRNFDGSTAGIAFLDALCSRSFFDNNELCNPEGVTGQCNFGVGTTQLLRSFGGNPNLAITALVLAHELGHNFGASHDDENGNTCGDNFIMAPSVNPSASGFSSCSETSIRNSISNLPNPEQCFNFPADLAIVELAGNPEVVNEASEFILDYQIDTQQAFAPVSGLEVSGSVNSAEGRYNSVMLNGQSCTVAGNGLSYQCQLDNPGNSLNLQVMAEANAGTADFNHQVAINNTNDVIDINTSNNSITSSLTVNNVAVPPDAVSGLAASQGTGVEIELTWQDNSTNETGFRVERRVNSGSFAEIATVSSNITNYTDTSTVAGTNYQYRVIAFNDDGDATASNIVSITPINPPAAANNLSASQGAGVEVDLSWQDNSDNETGFRIERRIDGGNFSEIASVSSNVTSYTDTTTSADTTYGYRVIAFNDDGDATASNIASARPTESSSSGNTGGNNSGSNGGSNNQSSSDSGGGSIGWMLIFALCLLLFSKHYRPLAWVKV